jgi:hypothetical protein
MTDVPSVSTLYGIIMQHNTNINTLTTDMRHAEQMMGVLIAHIQEINGKLFQLNLAQLRSPQPIQNNQPDQPSHYTQNQDGPDANPPFSPR